MRKDAQPNEKGAWAHSNVQILLQQGNFPYTVCVRNKPISRGHLKTASVTLVEMVATRCRYFVKLAHTLI